MTALELKEMGALGTQIAHERRERRRKPQLTEREKLYQSLMRLHPHFLTRFPQVKFAGLLRARYGVDEIRLMNLYGLADLVIHLQAELRKGAA